MAIPEAKQYILDFEQKGLVCLSIGVCILSLEEESRKSIQLHLSKADQHQWTEMV